jgi:cation diffusion facilitator family transporter
VAIEGHPAYEGVRAVRRGIAVNLALAAAKFITGIVGHSYALVADGVESSSDVVSSAVVYIGLKASARPPDVDHPYGHGKAEPLAALVVACALFAGALVIAYQSIQEIRTPHLMPAPFTLVVLAAVVLAKAALSRYSSGVAASIESGSVGLDAAHHFSDALTSALAFVGISVGLLTGLPQADDWAALCAVPVIAFTAIRHARSPIAELLDTAPPQIDADVRRVALQTRGVEDVEKCIVRKMGFSYYADLHVVVDGTMSVRAGHAIAHDVQAAIRAAMPRVAQVLVHIEPDDRTLTDARGLPTVDQR